MRHAVLLDDAAVEKLKSWMSDRFPAGMRCAMCWGKDWDVYPQLLTGVPLDPSGALTQHSVSPVVVAVIGREAAGSEPPVLPYPATGSPGSRPELDAGGGDRRRERRRCCRNRAKPGREPLPAA